MTSRGAATAQRMPCRSERWSPCQAQGLTGHRDAQAAAEALELGHRQVLWLLHQVVAGHGGCQGACLPRPVPGVETWLVLGDPGGAVLLQSCPGSLRGQGKLLAHQAGGGNFSAGRLHTKTFDDHERHCGHALPWHYAARQPCPCCIDPESHQVRIQAMTLSGCWANSMVIRQVTHAGVQSTQLAGSGLPSCP